MLSAAPLLSLASEQATSSSSIFSFLSLINRQQVSEGNNTQHVIKKSLMASPSLFHPPIFNVTITLSFHTHSWSLQGTGSGSMTIMIIIESCPNGHGKSYLVPRVLRVWKLDLGDSAGVRRLVGGLDKCTGNQYPAWGLGKDSGWRSRLRNLSIILLKF